MVSIKLSSTVALVAATVLSAAGAIMQQTCESAYQECQFKFQGESGLSTYNLQPELTDRAFTPIIVPKDPTKRIGVLNMNGIAPEIIADNGGDEPISSYGSPSFSPNHFKPFWISHLFGSGIGHETFQGDQAEVAKGMCVRIFFTSFQILENTSGWNVVVKNFNNVSKYEDKCVVFKTE